MKMVSPPARLSAARLRTRTVPWCFAMISELTHSPSPVPVTSLVVKNGSKMRRRTASVMDGASIRDNDARAANVGLVPCCGCADGKKQAATFCHCVKSIADEVGKQLTHLSVEGQQFRWIAIAPDDFDIEGVDAPLMQAQNRVQQFAGIDQRGIG